MSAGVIVAAPFVVAAGLEAWATIRARRRARRRAARKLELRLLRAEARARRAHRERRAVDTR